MSRPLALALVLLALPAAAETRRLAIVVGDNAGAAEHAPLRYAESDAAKMADVLVDLGGVEARDLLLLQGRSLDQVRAAFAAATARVAEWHRQPDLRVVVLFYFSGHSNGEALEVGPDRLPYAELRQWLKDTRAEVRLVIVDGCQSGALLQAKGAALSPAFDIRLHDELTSSGQALLTSSAANEVALESAEIQGSFFTHHLVSGLRGAADRSGDGRVTLDEAYEYAFAHTVTATAGTAVGPQHSAYDYALSGQGQLVLSELSRPGASIVLPEGLERALVTDLTRDRVVAEVVRGGAHRVVVSPGAYAVRAWRGATPLAGRFDLAPGQQRAVAWEELSPAAAPTADSKGGPGVTAGVASEPGESPAGTTLLLGLGAGHGVAVDLGPVASFEVGLRPAQGWGWAWTLSASTGAASGFRETGVLLRAGYLAALSWKDLQLYGGPELGAGALLQSLDSGLLQGTPALALAPLGGAAYRLTRSVSLGLEGDCPAAVVQLGGKLGVVWLPAAWLSVRASL